MARRLALIAVLALLCLGPALAEASSFVAIAVTPSGDGVLTIPVGGTGAFAAAIANFGAAPVGPVLVIVDTTTTTQGVTTTVWLPIVFAMCHTNPSTGECLGDLNAGSVVTFAPGEILTFSVFVQVTAPLGSDPVTNSTFNRVGLRVVGLGPIPTINPTLIFRPIPHVETSIEVRSTP